MIQIYIYICTLYLFIWMNFSFCKSFSPSDIFSKTTFSGRSSIIHPHSYVLLKRKCCFFVYILVLIYSSSITFELLNKPNKLQNIIKQQNFVCCCHSSEKAKWCLLDKFWIQQKDNNDIWCVKSSSSCMTECCSVLKSL